jgi:predicted secreted protein
MAAIKGNDLEVYIGGTLVGKATSATLNINSNLLDASTKESAGWLDQIAGQKSWDVSSEMLVDFSLSYGVSELYTAFVAGTEVVLVFGEGTGAVAKFEGNALVSSISINAANEELATVSASFNGTGSLTASNL